MASIDRIGPLLAQGLLELVDLDKRPESEGERIMVRLPPPPRSCARRTQRNA